MRVLVGTYTRGASEGIYVCDMDQRNGALEIRGVIATDNPSFLAMSPSGETLYAVNENAEGAVTAFGMSSGQWTPLSRRSTHGSSPCHLSVHPTGRHLYVANYGSGSLAVFPIEAESGDLGEASQVLHHEGSGPHPKRQAGPHAHSINLDPTGSFAYAPDLGIDRILIYRIDSGHGKLTPADMPFVAMAPGSGPRHFTLDPKRGLAFAVNELGCTVACYRWSAVNGALEMTASAETLPSDFEGRNTCADVHVSPDGRFLYASNRGHDSVAVFQVAPGGTELTIRQHVRGDFACPRNFAIDPAGRLLLVAGQDSDTVVAYRIDTKSGELTPTGAISQIPSPVCLLYAP